MRTLSLNCVLLANLRGVQISSFTVPPNKSITCLLGCWLLYTWSPSSTHVGFLHAYQAGWGGGGGQFTSAVRAGASAATSTTSTLTSTTSTTSMQGLEAGSLLKSGPVWEVCNMENEGTSPSWGIFASIAFAKSFLVTPSGYFVEGVLPFFEAGNKMWQRDSMRLVIISFRLAFMVVLFIRRRSRACWRDLGLTLGYWEDTRHATGVLRPHTLFGWRLKIIPNLV